MKPLCIYHANCQDGFTAAWVVRRFFDGDVDFHPGVHQEPPPDVTGRDVIIVDFSYKPPVLDEMSKIAKSILILDHHKSAAEDLEGIAPATSWDQSGEEHQHQVRAVFDMERSGAGIAWDFFFPDKRRPDLLNHIEDRDLWRFSLQGTREICAALFSYPYDFAVWDKRMTDSTLNLYAEGSAIERKHWKDVEELVAVTKREMTIGGHAVPVANLPYTLASDAGNMMAKTAAFAATYTDTPNGRVFSLRSVEGGADVSYIAKRYGGGGHKHAAGFKVPIGWEGDEDASESALVAATKRVKENRVS